MNLRPNSRYLFTKKNGKKFRATVIDVLCRESSDYKTLRLQKYEYGNGGNKIEGIVTIPYDWIKRANTLDDILRKKFVILPPEILFEIDTFN